MRTTNNCQPVIDQILSTWQPPLKGIYPFVPWETCCQTSSMIVFAFVMRGDFPWKELTEVQTTVVKQGVKVLETFN